MSISPENQRLLAEVLASGRFKTQDEALEEALHLLKEQQAETNGGCIPVEKWRDKFKAHLASTPASAATSLNDNRGSIYEGRGE